LKGGIVEKDSPLLIYKLQLIIRRGFLFFFFFKKKNRFRSFSLRSGSNNDKNLFNQSHFGRTIHQKLPDQGYIVGDAGYTLFKHLITPYPIAVEGNSEKDSHFNYLHSKTRIIVEQAFALLKNKFRIYKTEILWNNPFEIGDLICSTLIVHNWLIDLNDETEPAIINIEDWMRVGVVRYRENYVVGGNDAIIKRNAIRDYLFEEYN
jgi:hypothetical protein